MLKMSEMSKEQMIKDFGFNDSELSEIETFMNDNNDKTAKDILVDLIENKKLNNKQKILIAYVVGNSARDNAIKQEKGIEKGIEELYKGKIIGVNLPNFPLSAG